MESIYKLKGVVQHYGWGGTEFIPQLVGIENSEGKPFAEYWLGAHPNAPAMLDETNSSLYEWISRHPAEILGQQVADQFGSLPYLFKILDVRQMLSIQVHPSKASAIEEYEKENERGVPLTAPNRNYKDQNHKPESMVALSDFWLLHGFKEEEALKQILTNTKELSFLWPLYKEKGYKGLYEEVMTMPQEKVNEVLSPLLARIIPQYDSGTLQKSNENFWAARAATTFCKNNTYDRGIFSVYLFNLLHLKKGEAIYQPAGLPHAYLEGQNVEVMANSDNVLRAGLTDKHIDVPELMKHVKPEATHPKIIRANNEAKQAFDAPVEEFFLERYRVDKELALIVDSASILFAYDGEGKVAGGGKTVGLKKGEAVLLVAGSEIKIEPVGSFTFYKVSTPMNKN